MTTWEYQDAKRRTKRRTTWEYRVVRRMHGDEQELEIHEVYYDGGDTITMWSKSRIAPHGETLDEVIADLKLMAAATGKPVIEYADLPRRHPEGESDS